MLTLHRSLMFHAIVKILVLMGCEQPVFLQDLLLGLHQGLCGLGKGQAQWSASLAVSHISGTHPGSCPAGVDCDRQCYLGDAALCRFPWIRHHLPAAVAV